MSGLEIPGSGELSELAISAAKSSGKVLIDLWAEPRQKKMKGLRDWVTDADFAAQNIITELIAGKYPEHTFIAEEKNLNNTAGPFIWIVDPLDGTSNYSRQHPIFSVSIAVAVNLRLVDWTEPYLAVGPELGLVAGVVLDPKQDELFHATAGKGSWLKGKQITVSRSAVLESCILGLDWSHDEHKRELMLRNVSKLLEEVHTLRAIGSAALAMAWVAAGRLDAYLNLGIGPWDAAAAALIVSEAGGRATNLQGRDWQLSDAGCLMSNGPLHEKLLKVTTSS